METRGIVVLLAFALSLAVGIEAQQNVQNGQTPTKSDQAQDFVLRDAVGNKIGEWVVKNGSVELSTQTLPIPNAPIVPIPRAPNGQSPAVPIKAQLALRDAAGKQLGEWVAKTGAVLECHDATGKLIWSMPMKVFEQGGQHLKAQPEFP